MSSGKVFSSSSGRAAPTVLGPILGPHRPCVPGSAVPQLTGAGSLQERLTRAHCVTAFHAAPLSTQRPRSLDRRVFAINGALAGGAGTDDAPDRSAVASAVASMTRERTHPGRPGRARPRGRPRRPVPGCPRRVPSGAV